MKVDMSCCDQSPGLIARKIWQVLFKIYQSNGGDMDHLDSMLCDLLHITSIVTRSQKERVDVSFLWSCEGRWTDVMEMKVLYDGSTEVLYDPGNMTFEVIGYPQEPEKFGW